MRVRLLFRALPLLCLACACKNPGSPQAAQAATARILIGFDETVQTPGNELLASLGRELGCELQPLHPVGGNAYVYNCATTDTETSLARKLDTLNKHKGVRYAEIDRKRKIQN